MAFAAVEFEGIGVSKCGWRYCLIAAQHTIVDDIGAGPTLSCADVVQIVVALDTIASIVALLAARHLDTAGLAQPRSIQEVLRGTQHTFAVIVAGNTAIEGLSAQAAGQPIEVVTSIAHHAGCGVGTSRTSVEGGRTPQTSFTGCVEILAALAPETVPDVHIDDSVCPACHDVVAVIGDTDAQEICGVSPEGLHGGEVRHVEQIQEAVVTSSGKELVISGHRNREELGGHCSSNPVGRALSANWIAVS